MSEVLEMPEGEPISDVQKASRRQIFEAQYESGRIAKYFGEAIKDYCARRRPTGEVLWGKILEWSDGLADGAAIVAVGGRHRPAWSDLPCSWRAMLDVTAICEIALADALARYFPPALAAPSVQAAPTPIEDTIYEQVDGIDARDEHRAAAADGAFASAPAPIEGAALSIDDDCGEGDDLDDDLDDGLEVDEDADDFDRLGSRQEAVSRMDADMGAVIAGRGSDDLAEDESEDDEMTSDFLVDDPGDGSACGPGSDAAAPVDDVRTIEIPDAAEPTLDGDKASDLLEDAGKPARRRR